MEVRAPAPRQVTAGVANGDIRAGDASILHSQPARSARALYQ